MTFSIREIEEQDFEALLLLVQEFAFFEKQSGKMTNSIERMRSEKEFLNGFVAISASNEIIAYATFFFAYYTWSGKSLYMDDLYVKNEFRGNGIGTKLIQQILHYANSKNCKRLRWQVSEWNKPAIDFYKSIGASIDDVQLNCELSF